MKKSKQSVKGIFKSHRLGFGFVAPDPKEFAFEIFIPKNSTLFAVEGDLVKVQIVGKDAKGYEGKIVEIIDRKLKNLGGTITEIMGPKAFLQCPLLGPSKEIEFAIPKGQTLRKGDRVELTLNPKKCKKRILGKFKKYLGKIEDATIDTEAAITEFGLRSAFPQDVLDEVKNLPLEIDPKQYTDREDLQDLICFTIDPETAKDYDDAISLEKTKNGNYELGVHIADVSYFVREGSAIDKEAFFRCNSTYFPDKCVSMLPKELADNLCSLKPNVPRLAVSTMMTFDADGEMLSYRIARTIIKSRERFSYEQVKEILDQKYKHPLSHKIVELEKMALILKQKRKERGSIDLSLADSKVMLDPEGMPIEIKVIEYDITHQMIEEFMLKNNEVIAKHLSDRNVSIPFRIHEEPKADNISSFIQLVETLGVEISKTPTQKDLQALFDDIKGSHLENYLSIHFIKCMKLAYYSPTNIGHYGLQLQYYCHFTSPIRRYVDLVIHRRVFNEIKEVNVLEIAERCSDQERLSAKAENSVRDLKMLRYFKLKKNNLVYEGIITKLKPFGIFFEIPELLYEGFIHVSSLGNDYYVFDEINSRFKGNNSHETFEVRKKIKVKTKLINFISREIEWERITKE